MPHASSVKGLHFHGIPQEVNAARCASSSGGTGDGEPGAPAFRWKDTLDPGSVVSTPGKRTEQTQQYQHSPDSPSRARHNVDGEIDVESARIVLAVRPIPAKSSRNEFARDMPPPSCKKS